uniref:Uncharacterized protein n=1 Tax=Lepeophtheirus salmonis TaxID=72036 RepID=A0A0K2UZ52_LEPSM
MRDKKYVKNRRLTLAHLSLSFSPSVSLSLCASVRVSLSPSFYVCSVYHRWGSCRRKRKEKRKRKTGRITEKKEERKREETLATACNTRKEQLIKKGGRKYTNNSMERKKSMCPI